MQGQFMFHYGNEILEQFEFWNSFRSLKIGQTEYRKALHENAKALKELGLNDWHLSRLAYMQADDDTSSNVMIKGLMNQGVIHDTNYDRAGYYALRRLVYELTDYSHYITYIMDDEALVAYALSDIIRPKRVFCAGSYFGFWAQWLLPGVRKAEGKAILSDINPEVSELSRKNLDLLGLGDVADIQCVDAIELLEASDETIDLLMVDATGAWDDPRTEYGGKALYVPIVRAALHRLRKGSVVLVHNHELEAVELKPLYDMLNKKASAFVYMESFNCMGVYVI